MAQELCIQHLYYKMNKVTQCDSVDKQGNSKLLMTSDQFIHSQYIHMDFSLP